MNTPEAKADRLVAALRANTHALHSVRRRYRWVLVLTAVLAFTLGYSVYSNYQNDVESCQSANRIRADLNDKFDSTGAFLTEAIEDTPQNQELIALVEKELEIRDCSEIGWLG